MRPRPWPLERFKRISQSLAALAIVISGAALVGWFTGLNTLKSFRPGYIPMAPNTAVVFLLFATALSIIINSKRFVRLARVTTFVPLTIVLARLGEYLTGRNFSVDGWLFRFPAERLGLAPVGKMAFFTALAFLLSGSAVLLLTFAKSRVGNTFAQALAVIVVFIGLAFSLGYLYSNPLTYDSHAIPMALNTAICFCLLGAALVVKTSVRSIRERRLIADALQRARDELERRVSERTAELQAQEEVLRTVIDASPNAIFVKDSAGRFTLVNKALEDACGRSAAQIIGRTDADVVVNQEEVRRFVGDDSEVVQTLKPKFIPEEKLTNPKTGETRFFETIKVPLKLPGSQTVQILGVATDITERKQTAEALRASEDQLRRSQKLEGIGQLAGGIAHDFNNLLTVIGGYSKLLLAGNGLDPSARDKLQEVNKAADRAAALTRQLLAFSRKQVLQPEVLNLNTLVEDLGKMLSRLIGEHIEIATLLRPEVGKIYADPGQIEQVIVNLVVNARDAMPKGGKISIETANVDLDNAYAGMHIAVKAGRYVMLAVSDTGNGMDAETRKHIFEPFFTTKEMGRGTGLGLSTIYGIVKQSDGNIWVYSEVGKGSTFKIYLPLAQQEETKGTRSPKETILFPSHETILLVEDDPTVRHLSRDILASNGYTVVAAENGREAIEICKEYEGEIHLMLTDVIMPRMDGKQLAESVARCRGGMKVLFMSGYTDDAIVRHGVLEPGTHFIEKPFTPTGLLSKVRATLGERAASKNG